MVSFRAGVHAQLLLYASFHRIPHETTEAFSVIYFHSFLFEVIPLPPLTHLRSLSSLYFISQGHYSFPTWQPGGVCIIHRQELVQLGKQHVSSPPSKPVMQPKVGVLFLTPSPHL